MMKATAKLKDKARQHELKEEWTQAIQAYEEAIRMAEAGDGAPELSLYNRVGDLHLRIGRQSEAVRCYERAADRYADAGLYNNAIALCNKALRHAPQRADLYRKLGRLSASQGFLTDARRWSVQYAEIMLRAGAPQEAFEALEELGDLSNDPEVRELLAGHLRTHGETARAAEQLRKAYIQYANSDQPDRAESAKRKLLELDPNADLTVPPPSHEDTGPAWGAGDALPGLEIQSTAESAGLPAVGEPAGPPDSPPVDPFAAGPADAGGMAEDAAGAADPLPLLDMGDFGDGPATADPIVDPTPEATADPIIDAPPEPIAAPEGFEPAAYGTLPGLQETAFGEDDAEDAEVDPLPLLEPGPEDDPPGTAAGADDLPLLDPFEDDSLPEPPQDPPQSRAVPAHPSPADRLSAELLSAAADPEPETAVHDALIDLDVDGGLLELGPSNGATPPGASDGAPPGPAGDPPGGAGNDYIDLGSLLEDEDAGPSGAPDAAGDDDADLVELLAQFKAMGTEQVGEEDPESHYDLGLAFKEMGLVDEAIAEFRIALRAGGTRLKIYEELGQCFIEKQAYDVAGRILAQALRLPRDSEHELLGVYYHLGLCYEALGRPDDAREAYRRVSDLDPRFRDVTNRLARL